MDEAQLKTVRLERTLTELRALQRGIGDWLATKRASDTDAAGKYVGRHKTQLQALDSLLRAAADALETGAQGVLTDPSAPPPSVAALYEVCREYDQAAVWLQRLWEFFRQKLDQREQDEYARLLKAADEVVWSCYHSVMERARQRRAQSEHGPSPLPFVAFEYSPAAIESDRPLPPGLTPSVDPPGWDDEIDEMVRALPMGLLQLPPWCVSAPWWLLYIAHEVGHHIESDLSLHAHVTQVIDAVSAANAALAPRWRAWSKEVFADFFSVLMVGRWAAWSVLEVERSTPARMVQPKPGYPPPIVRVALLAAAARALDPQSAPALAGLDLDTLKDHYPAASPHLDVVDHVIDALRTDLPDGLGKLEDLCAFDAESFRKAVTYWKTRLSENKVPATTPRIETARQVIAASVARYADILEETNEAQRAVLLAGLSQITIQTLHASAVPGTRGERLPDGERPGLGAALARRLTTLGADQGQPASAGS